MADQSPDPTHDIGVNDDGTFIEMKTQIGAGYVVPDTRERSEINNVIWDSTASGNDLMS